jgi:hypothetical protein
MSLTSGRTFSEVELEAAIAEYKRQHAEAVESLRGLEAAYFKQHEAAVATWNMLGGAILAFESLLKSPVPPAPAPEPPAVVPPELLPEGWDVGKTPATALPSAQTSDLLVTCIDALADTPSPVNGEPYLDGKATLA